MSMAAESDAPHGDDTRAGLLLAAATVAALAVANSPWRVEYAAILHTVIAGLSLIHWVNDGLMALFFLLVGLEVKRELVAGALRTPASRVLPGAAAVAGMIVPALLYLAVVGGNPAAVRGWAVPAATDIAFALAVLAALGKRVPPALRVFLTAIAIIDDLGAIVIIGVAYTAAIHFVALAAAVAGVAVLAGLNRAGVRTLVPYLLVGALVWVAVLASGVHATLAGVAVALTIPLGDARSGTSPLLRLEHALAPVIGYAILPIFAFANAGIPLGGDSIRAIAAPVPLAIIVALVVGKQLGVFGATWLLVRLRFAVLPAATSWRQLYGVALLCGIGFTMSLFIASLAFGEGSAADTMAKTGILIGSLVAAMAGFAVLRTAR